MLFAKSVNQVLNKARDTAGTRAQKSLKETNKNNVKNMGDDRTLDYFTKTKDERRKRAAAQTAVSTYSCNV